MKIHDIIPDADVLIGLAPEEVAFSLLRVARENLQSGSVYRDVVISTSPGPGQDAPYPQEKQEDVHIALLEALLWMEINAILLPAPGINGANGFRVLGRRAANLANREQFNNFQRASAFPKALLHPSIADRIWIALARGELADGVFTAFRAVEEAVRDAGGFQSTDVGVSLMRAAFHPDTGPLSDQNQPRAEREALMHLFAGAIGSHKNPHSHRTVAISDYAEAQEMVILASHLLRIVETRVP